MKRLLLIAALLLAAAPAFSQTLNFTLETSSPDGKTVVPRLTWSTSPAATSCSAAWTTSTAAAGVQILPAVSATSSYGITCTWPGVTKAAITWSAPTTNVDGSAYSNPGGYRVVYGKSATALDTSVYLQDPAARTWTSPALTAGTWFFGVRAYNAQGLESDLSNVASKTMTAAANQTRTLELTIRFPNPPTNLTVE